MVRGVDTQWDIDLADLALLGKSNAGTKYFLLVVDVFSRYVWVRPLKSKYAKDVINALDSILSQGQQPKTVRSDGGREFQNRAVRSFLNERGVHLFRTYNETQANYAERAIKMLKSKLYRYLISRNTLSYLGVLQDLVTSYNNTVHSSKGRPPSGVDNDTEDEVRLDQYMLRRKPHISRLKQHVRLKLGDRVRISYRREAFDREYGQRWSGEIFTITASRKRDGIPIYRVTDWNGAPIQGTFYQQQLQKVDVSDGKSFKIERIIKRRRLKGKTQLYVKWLHWPKSFNQWVNLEDIISP